ncbi:histidine phosphatase family protein [Mucilaginibacter sp.]|uniref:histidine phosphatase family protein n=1 Tax=Mucilaginibacter sp. TaxID=1882438 RepID=UPI002632360F|nr:histidine phosphatase family protein [Mucilaginibacter sp.]MDB4920198.1 phosphohistidine phosphatase SixA [Mucilaginibacter sp.]
MKILAILSLGALFLLGCSRDKTTDIPTPVTPTPLIKSPEYIDKLLFVNSNNYQILTTDPATFYSSDTHIQINSTGLIKRLTSAEIVPIEITWKNKAIPKTTIYALGATDIDQDPPFTHYQGALATDAPAAYQQGWKTLQSLPVKNETYAIVLRHADASNGVDFSVNHNYPGPPNWWKSKDPSLARQLNDQGVQRATILGQVFKDLNYPIKRVITSEFNRAIETGNLINAGPAPVIDGRINHPSYTVYPYGLFQGMLAIIKEQPIDNKMTLIIAHHPINELRKMTGYPTFPDVSPFNWTGAYLIKISPDKQITYQGAVSWAMFKYWRDLKLHLN